MGPPLRTDLLQKFTINSLKNNKKINRTICINTEKYFIISLCFYVLYRSVDLIIKRFQIFLFLFLLVSINAHGQVSRPSVAVELIKREFIFQHPPFKACHASTIVELSKGRLMAAWFGGSYEGARDVGIWVSVCNADVWSEPREVVSSRVNDSLQQPCWNPVLFKTSTGKLFLFYKQGKSPREWWGMVLTSSDNGNTWGKPQRLPDGFLGPIKNKPVLLKNGEILCPSSTESPDQKQWKVHLEITNENLSRWERIPVDTFGNFGVIQPSILFHPGGKLQMLCRSRQNCIVQSWGDAKGRHWSSLSQTEVPNPNSGIDALSLENGWQMLVYNPLLTGKEWFNGRNVLTVAISKDGIHWNNLINLEEQQEGEFSYPAVIQSSDGLIHISYTYNRINIRHVVLQMKA